MARFPTGGCAPRRAANAASTGRRQPCRMRRASFERTSEADARRFPPTRETRYGCYKNSWPLSLGDVALANYFAGLETRSLDGGTLPRDIVCALGLPHGTRLRISDYTLTKIRIKHPDIGFRELVALPHVLANGFLVAARRKRPSIECCYFDPSGQPFTAAKVAIKATADGKAYLSTFHRLTAQEARRLYRGAVRHGLLLRDLKKELARLLAAPIT